MTKRSMSFTLLIAFCAVGVVASLAFVAVSANESNGGVVCLADADGNGTVEITELFNVIDWYFNETRCLPDSSDWTVSQIDGEPPIYSVLSQRENAPGIGPWYLSLECVNQDRGHIGVFMGTIWKDIYPNTEDTRITATVEIDGEVSEQTWWHVVSDDLNDYLSYAQPAPDQSPLIEQLLTADSVIFDLPPPPDDPYVIQFSVSGLDQHIKSPSELCNEPEGTTE